MPTSFESPITLPDGVVVNKAIGANAGIELSKLEQRTFAKFNINLLDFRVHDDIRSFLPDEATADDLGLETSSTYGTNVPVIDSGDLASAGATTRYARFTVDLPANYEDGETVQIRVRTKFATVADTSSTVDLQAFKFGEAGAVSGSDLVSTSATNNNSATAANYDFTITSASLVAGDQLDCRLALAITDGATGSGVICYVESVKLLCDTRG